MTVWIYYENRFKNFEFLPHINAKLYYQEKLIVKDLITF